MRILKYLNHINNLIGKYLIGILIANGIIFLFTDQKLYMQNKILLLSSVNTFMVLSYVIDFLLFHQDKKNIANIFLIFTYSIILENGIENQYFDIFNPNIFFILFLCGIFLKMGSTFLLNEFSEANQITDNSQLKDIQVNKDKQDPRTKKELEVAAIHEAGHFIMAKLLDFKVAKVSIEYSKKRGDGGYVKHIPPNLIEEGYQKKFIMMIYAGTIAEKIMLGTSYPLGRYSDLDQATEMITNYIKSGETKYGLVNLDLITTDKERLNLYAEISHDLEEETSNILNSNKKLISYMKNELIQKKTFSGEEIDKLWERLKCLEEETQNEI